MTSTFPLYKQTLASVCVVERDCRAKRDILTVRLHSLGALSMCKRCRQLMRCAWHEAAGSVEPQDASLQAKIPLRYPERFRADSLE
jgi:hypothetical protein